MSDTPLVSIDAEFAPKLQGLFVPRRFKTLWGGRSAGRSWGVARALLILGCTQIPGMPGPPLRVLCARELQKSIAESVHQLLVDQIGLLKLESLYEVQNAYILGRSGTSAAGTIFLFEGIKNNVNKIKSFEGIDIAWIEEAIKVSKASWNILIPTIRKAGSEIWMTFNPELEEDYTYKEFVLGADPIMSWVCKMTWEDNPWLPEPSRVAMETMRKKDEDTWLNVWQGHPLALLEGAVYAREIRRAREENRITQVPCDREWPVEVFADLGRADNTALWFAQRVAMQIRVVAYREESGRDWPFFLKLIREMNFQIGTIHLPHDAKAKRLGAPHTIEAMTRQAGFDVHIVQKLSLSDGINAARVLFPTCWFDEAECADGLKALRHYKYKVVEGQLSREPLHDSASDGADAYRYMALSIGRGAVHRQGKASRVLDRLARSAPRIDGAPLGWMAS